MIPFTLMSGEHGVDPTRIAAYVVSGIALLILVAHLALQSAARRIDRLPASGESEVETLYRFRGLPVRRRGAVIRIATTVAVKLSSRRECRSLRLPRRLAGLWQGWPPSACASGRGR